MWPFLVSLEKYFKRFSSFWWLQNYFYIISKCCVNLVLFSFYAYDVWQNNHFRKIDPQNAISLKWFGHEICCCTVIYIHGMVITGKKKTQQNTTKRLYKNKNEMKHFLDLSSMAIFLHRHNFRNKVQDFILNYLKAKLKISN